MLAGVPRATWLRTVPSCTIVPVTTSANRLNGIPVDQRRTIIHENPRFSHRSISPLSLSHWSAIFCALTGHDRRDVRLPGVQSLVSPHGKPVVNLRMARHRGLVPVTKFTKKDGMPPAFAMQLTADSPFPHSFPANFPSPPHYLSKAIAPDAARYPSSLALRTGIRADFSTQH